MKFREVWNKIFEKRKIIRNYAIISVISLFLPTILVSIGVLAGIITQKMFIWDLIWNFLQYGVYISFCVFAMCDILLIILYMFMENGHYKGEVS